MNYISDVKIKLNQLIFAKGRTKKDVTAYDCAEIVGKSYNYLWKICSPTEDHPFPLEFVVPLMRAKNNYDVLELMAHTCGFALVKLPRVGIAKQDQNEMVEEMQLTANKVVGAFMDFFKSGSKDHYMQVIDCIMVDVQTKLSVKKYVEKKVTGQIELRMED